MKSKREKPIEIDTQIYLSGPMTGIPGWNAKAFRAAAKLLRVEGFTVFDPSETDLGIDQGTPEAPAEGIWNEFLRFDIVALMKCEVVFVLPGWRGSKGAKLEVLIAEAVGMAVYEYRSRKHIRETILQEADRIVSGDRQRSYGHPLEDFTRTGEFWYPILKDLGLTGPIPAERVGLMMVALKMSREIHNPSRENRVDMGGYTKTLDLIAQRKEISSHDLKFVANAEEARCLKVSNICEIMRLRSEVDRLERRVNILIDHKNAIKKQAAGNR